MKKIVKLSAVLSWINLIMGAILVAGGLLATVISPSAFTVLFSVILPGSVILHSYAALQLRKSINYPTLPLNTQTPVGIRMMGYMALFFGIMSIGNAGVILQQAPEAAKQLKLQLPAQAKNLDVVALLRASGIFTILLSISIIINVVLNLRLLRWYLFYRDKEKDGKQD
jgi:hypothetical protein